MAIRISSSSVASIALVALVCAVAMIVVVPAAAEDDDYIAYKKEQDEDDELPPRALEDSKGREVSHPSLIAHDLHPVMTPKVHGIGFILNKQEMQCVHIVAQYEKDRISMAFRSESGTPDFDVRVMDSAGNVVFNSKADEHDGSGKIFFVAKAAGEHRLCIDNSHYTSVATNIKVVRAMVAVQTKKESQRRLSPLTKQLSRCAASLASLVEGQEEIKVRENRHRITLESNNTRVAVRWFFEALALLGMSVGQVFYLRRIFAKKKSVRSA
jgi:hypothetical protein